MARGYRDFLQRKAAAMRAKGVDPDAPAVIAPKYTSVFAGLEPPPTNLECSAQYAPDPKAAVLEMRRALRHSPKI